MRQVADGRSSPGRTGGARRTSYRRRIDLLSRPRLPSGPARRSCSGRSRRTSRCGRRRRWRSAIGQSEGAGRSGDRPFAEGRCFGDAGGAADVNLALEYERNAERFSFLRWCQGSFDRLRVVPPGKGIMHQINLEYLAKVVWTEETPDGIVAYPDTLVGTDSHSTMINGLGVLGWGVGGIEAEAVMLGKPVSLPVPEVVGVEVIGTLPEGTTPTDLVLTITEKLRTPWRGRQVRRILRAGPGCASGRDPRHDRQHGARVWRHLRLLPPGLARARLPAADRTPGGTGPTGRSLCQGAGALA